MTTKKDERLLYERISDTVFKWAEEQNKKGKKPRQSTIVGSLDMVKIDWYIGVSIDRNISKRVGCFLKQWHGKKIEVDHNGTITIVAIKPKDESK